ncbi:MAG: WXG100 family type VII secretion target [Jatrophihabitans sp.]|uniref:WXG100 family type VII secretion target n=1 Tax=Jatrophihabitans sp. TaxID=1932789 RepID=UPI003F7EE82D
MTRQGMDPDKIRTLAGQADQQALRLSQLITTVDGLVRRIDATWRGRREQQFVATWHSHLRPALTRVQHDVSTMASSARANAAEQESASSAGSTSWSGLIGGIWTMSAMTAGTTIGGLPYAASGSLFAVAQASGHLQADADGAEVQGAARAGVGAQDELTLGDPGLNLHREDSVFLGAQASGSAGARLDGHGYSEHVEADASAGVTAESSTRIGNDHISFTSTNEAFAGARADYGQHLHVGTDGFAIGGHAGVFAGAEDTQTDTVHVGPLTSYAGAGVSAGVGGGGAGDLSLTTHDIGFDVDLDPDLFGWKVPVSIKGGSHLDPTQALDDVTSGFANGWHYLTGSRH